MGILGGLGGYLGASWGILGASWGYLGASWSILGAYESILGASWRILEASWSDLEAKGSPRELFYEPVLANQREARKDIGVSGHLGVNACMSMYPKNLKHLRSILLECRSTSVFTHSARFARSALGASCVCLCFRRI